MWRHSIPMKAVGMMMCLGTVIYLSYLRIYYMPTSCRSSKSYGSEMDMDVQADNLARLLMERPELVKALLAAKQSVDSSRLTYKDAKTTTSSDMTHSTSTSIYLYRNNMILHDAIGRNDSFSSHYCVGGGSDDTFNIKAEQREVDWYFRRCIFRNVGLDRHGLLVYHKSPDERQPFMDGKRRLDFRKYFPVNMRFSDNPIHSSRYRRDFPDDPSRAIIFVHDGDYGHIPGHDFDSIWTAFNSMLSTGMLSLKNEVVLRKSVTSKANEFIKMLGENARKAGSPVRKFWSTIASKGTYFDDFLEKHNGTLLPFVLLSNNHRGAITFPTFRNSLSPRLYRDRALFLLHIPLPVQSTVPHIAVRYKASDHAFTNHVQIIEHLQRRYPKAIITDFRAQRDTPVREELLMMTSFDIIITPCGGGSFSSIFLRDGGTAIFGSVCWPGRSREKGNSILYGQELLDRNGTEVYCFRMDTSIWTLMPHFHKRYIRAVSTKDIAPPKWEINDKRVHAKLLRYSYSVDFDQLDQFVDEALLNSHFHMFSVSKKGFKRTAD